MGIVLCVGIASLPVEIDTSFDTFMKTDVPASIIKDAFFGALDARDETNRLTGRRLQGGIDNRTTYAVKDLFLIYQLDDSGLKDGILHSKSLVAIHRFEQHLAALLEWRQLCRRAEERDQRLCSPGLSFANYRLSTLEFSEGSRVAPETIIPDGNGWPQWDPIPLETAVHFVNERGLGDILMPEDFDPSSQPLPQTAVLRSAFRFRVPCVGTDAQRAEVVRQFNAEWVFVLETILLPVLRAGLEGIPMPSDGDPPPLRVLYDGSNVRDMELQLALSGDMLLAAWSAFLVLGYLVFHTRSFILSLTGLLVAMSSVPLAYVFCAVLVGSTTVNFSSFLALFLAIGFGCDVIFVYQDFWSDSVKHREDDVDRLVWTWYHAGKASFATTATTSLSFFANLASVIRALRQLGFFMGLCVMLAWILISLIFVPLCLVEERRFISCRVKFGAKDKKVLILHETSDDDLVSARERALGRWVDVLHRWRHLYCILPVILVFIFFGLAISSVELADGAIPSMFPEDHNQNRVSLGSSYFKSSSDAFAPSFSAPRTSEPVCDGPSFEDHPSCSLFWCEARSVALSPAESDGLSCSCRQRERPPCPSSAWAPSLHWFVSTTRLEGMQRQSAQNHAVKSASGGSRVNNVSNRDLPPLVLQDWEEGSATQAYVTEISVYVSRRGRGDAWCGVEESCFCGSHACSVWGTEWGSAEEVEVARRLEGPQILSRKLQDRTDHYFFQPTVSRQRRAKVWAVFGMEVDLAVPFIGEFDPEQAWSIVEDFDIREPWSQRNMFRFCTQVPDSLRVLYRWCWLERFKDWLHTTRETPFPARYQAFPALALEFAATGALSGTDYFWMRDDDIVAIYFSFLVDVSLRSAPKEIIAYKAHWDRYVDDYNAEAGQYAGGAFHLSLLWISAEAMDELYASTLSTLLILIVLAFAGMVTFTRSLSLSLWVVATTIGVVFGLAFYVVVVMRWSVGLIEGIALVYFIGYAVTYSLHVAHTYADNEGLCEVPDSADHDDAAAIRLRRTSFALRSIGGAAFGSAATTAGSSIVLVFGTLTIFKKLGGMCLAVTVMSIFAAMAPLPAALLIFGPLRPGALWCSAGASLPFTGLRAGSSDALESSPSGAAGAVCGVSFGRPHLPRVVLGRGEMCE